MNKINLCDDCKHSVPTCKAGHLDVKYGPGIHDDNIVECKYYVLKEKDGE